MSNVRSVSTAQRQRASHDWPILLGKLAVWLAALSFGCLIWAVNGGYSVIGLHTLSLMFNEQGRALWAGLSLITFTVPGPTEVLGLSKHQPLLPWLGVISASMLQVIVAYLTFRRRAVPAWLAVAALIISAYDVVTTFLGLRTVRALLDAPAPIVAVLAVFVTFAVETTIGFLIKRRL